MKKITTNLEETTYLVTLCDEDVTIEVVTLGLREVAGHGTWAGHRVIDCTADLPEEHYLGIDEAIEAELNK